MLPTIMKAKEYLIITVDNKSVLVHKTQILLAKTSQFIFIGAANGENPAKVYPTEDMSVDALFAKYLGDITD